MNDEDIRAALLARAEHQSWREISVAIGVGPETLRQFSLDPVRPLGAKSRAAVLRYLTPAALDPTIAEEIRLALGHARETVRLLEAVVSSARRHDEAQEIALREAAAKTAFGGDLTKRASAAARPRTSAAE